MAYERDDKITIEINHCLAYRKFAKLVENFISLVDILHGAVDIF